jgi:glycosyltransferase involved in cell wall biosynthesis
MSLSKQDHIEVNVTDHEDEMNLLVSVVVITYNSSEFVLETLESAKAQTYENIELIISDDGSTDDTVEICTQWLAENRARFRRTELVTVEKNTGIPANCNRGLKAAHGIWLKYIAGDDLLLPTCVDLFVRVTIEHPDAKCFVSDMYSMQNRMVDKYYKIFKSRLKKSAKLQLRNFIKYGPIPGPALFLEKDAILSVGGYNEQYTGVEDYPLYISLCQAGYYFVPVSKPTVVYRVHGNSITHSPSSSFLYSFQSHHEQVIIPLIWNNNLYLLAWHYFLKKKKMTIALSMIVRLSDIYYWRNKIFKLLGLNQNNQVRVTSLNKSVNCIDILRNNS